jgi:SPP1 family predicted phage head-tail adaptor
MRAGKLKTRVTIQRPVEGNADGLNEQPVSWVNVVTVSAEILPQSGREFYRAQQVNAAVTHVVRIRYRRGVDETLRLALGDPRATPARVLKIASVVNVDEANEEMLLVCVEEK